jgi:poly(A) polymerase
MQSPWIQAQYHISDVSGIHITPYGQVVIAKYPFKVSYFEYSSHKRVIIASFNLNDRIVNVPVVHLTSDHGKGNLGAKRLSQMTTIYNKTVPDLSDLEKDNGADCFIIGDFNMGDGGEGEALSIRPDFVDCWKTLCADDPGYTFDPKENALASITTKTGVRRRYDRIIVRSAGFHWQPLSCSLINTEPIALSLEDLSVVHLPPSDHFGIMAQLQFLDDSQERSALVSAKLKSIQRDREATQSLASFLVAEHMLESKEQILKRHTALQYLQTLIQRACPTTEGFRLIPVGSFSLGLQTPDSDLDVLCCSSLNTGDFFSTLTRFLHAETRRDSSSGAVQMPRLVLDAVVPVISVSILGVPMDIQYAQVRNVNFNRSFDLGRMLLEAETKTEVRNQFDQASFLAAQSVRAVDVLTSLIPDLSVFQKAYACIKRWASAKGLNSNRMGFLGGHAWTIMLTRVAQSNPRASIFGLVSAFFATYSEWDFRTNPVTVLVRPAIGYSHVSKKEPVCVITCSPPYKNITRNATHSSRRVLITELQKAHSLTAAGGNAQEILQELWKPSDFFKSHSTYLQVNFAAATYKEYSHFAGQIESRLVQLLLLLESTPVVLARPWSTRFVYKSSSFHYGGSFFIGLSPIKENLREKEAQKSGGHLDLAKYADDFIAAMERWAGFSPETMRISIKQRARDSFTNELPVQETSETYPASSIVDEDSDPEEEEMGEEEILEISANHTPASSSSATAASSSSTSTTQTSSPSKPNGTAAKDAKAKPAQKGGKKKGNQVEQDSQPKRRMKTSEECINWIKHDGRFNPEEFIISYEDRFVGLMEVALTDFTSDQSSDVFIPMHRVWLIKQNGRIVWDRKNRLDILGEAFRQ